MKKWMSLLLAAVLVLSLCACGKAGADPEQTPAPAASNFKVGYAKKDITPTYSVPLGGYGNSSFRMSDGYLDYLYTTAIALTDGTNTVVLIENDLQAAVKTVLEKVRKNVSEATGIPEANIMVGVSHTHAAPDLWNGAEGSIAKYSAEVVEAMTENALAALENMQPVTISVGTGVAEGVSFVRHYTLEDGHVRGPNFGLQYDSPKVGYTHEPDRTMQVVRFDRAEGKDIVLVNFQSHPQKGTSNTSKQMTADTVGWMRNQVEASGEYEFMYFLGASGDVVATSLIEKDNVYSDYKAHGKAMGMVVQNILANNMQQVNAGEVKAIAYEYEAVVDHSEAMKAGAASEILKVWQETNDFNRCVEMGEPHGINSPYHAKSIVNKTKYGDSLKVDIYAFSIGDLAFIAAPYEMFCENGKFIKDNSPYTMTFVMTMANDTFNYLSSEEGYDYNCYESNTCPFVRGTAEDLADQFVELLKQLHG